MQLALFLLLLSAQMSAASAGRTIATPKPNKTSAAVVEDNDGDGWTVSQGDCQDVPTLANPYPERVNPGAFEIPGNGIDDDCDGIVDNAPVVCDGGLASNPTDPLAYAQAIDLCKTTTENPSIDQRRWGVISAQLFLADGTGSPAAESHSIRPSFGSGNTPQFGSSLSVLSTGHAAATGQTNPAYAAFQGGSVMGTQSAFPSDWFTAHANQLPNTPGCPTASGSVAIDPVMVKIRIRVPTNARSFSVSTRFFGAEYPEWVCSAYDDYYLVLLDSTFAGAPANPADKNIAQYTAPNNSVYTIGTGLAHGNTGLFDTCTNGSTGCASVAVAGTTSTCSSTAGLTGTGFDVVNPPPQFTSDPGYCGSNNLLGGGTAWLTTSGNVVPGETIELRFVIWDTGDGYYDSVALLDNFQWSVEPTTPGTFISGQVPRPHIAPSAPAGVVATAQTPPTSVSITWNAVSSATSYQVFRRGAGEVFGQIGSVTGLSFTDTMTTANTSYLYRVRAVNDVGPSPDSTSNLATTVAFSDDPLAPGTAVRATHLSELRTAVNAVRQLSGLTPAGFTDTASAGVVVKAVHVTELRSALDAAMTQLGLPSGGYTDPALSGVAIKAAHPQEIRNRVK